jgi:hypothetical protein
MKNLSQAFEGSLMEMTALLSSQGLKSSIVEPTNKHQPNLIVGKVG